jgi:hypothetical protein
MRFALVGKIDVNRDGRDDRTELKRMIMEAGGTVEFDLPPADVGKEYGKLSPRIDWYITDDRIPLRDTYKPKTASVEVAQDALNKKVGAVIKEARLDGIRPMTIERLLAFLGYDISAPVLGRTESVDVNSMRRLTSPRRTGEASITKPAIDATKDQAKPDDSMPDADAADSKKKAATKKDDDAGSGN